MARDINKYNYVLIYYVYGSYRKLLAILIYTCMILDEWKSDFLGNLNLRSIQITNYELCSVKTDYYFQFLCSSKC